MGNGPEKQPPFAGIESPVIAHDGLVAGAGFRALDAGERYLPANHAPACRELSFGKEKRRGAA
jgi:hypothetical protein